MAGVFVSYRRQDAHAHAGRLHDALARRYGSASVFLDVASLEPGASWAQELARAVETCEVMLVVIGPRWTTALDAAGRPRLEDPDDAVRLEVGHALRHGRPVVPVLVDGAVLPAADALPDELAPLLTRHAIRIDDAAWAADVAALYRVLDRLLTPSPVGSVPSPTIPRPGSAGSSPGPGTEASPEARPGLWSRVRRAVAVLAGRDDSGAGVGAVHAPGERVAPAAPPAASAAPTAAPTRTAAPAPTPVSEPDVRAHDVFVSHASADEAVADAIVAAIEADGHRCWISHRDLPPGAPSYGGPIVEAIADSRLLLVLLTEHSIASIEVVREVTIAATDKVPMLAVRLDETPLSSDLRYFFVAGQRLDLFDEPVADRPARIVPAVARCLPRAV